MNKKKIILIVMILMVCAGGGAGVYLLYLNIKAPTTFYSDEELIEEINRYDYTRKAQTIVDKIEVDERHYYVPIQFSNGYSGMSFWKWKMGKWQLVQFSTEKILSWQLDEQDGATRYIVWHSQNMQDVDLSMYLMRERSYSIYYDDHRYDPKIQLEHQLQVNSYGIEPLPKEWRSIIRNIEQPNEKIFFDKHFTMEVNIWVQVADTIFTFSPEYHNGYWTGNADSTFEYPLYIEDIELE